MTTQMKGDVVEQKLDAILTVLQDLLILEASKAGVKRDNLREFLPLNTNRISRVMKHVRRTKDGSE